MAKEEVTELSAIANEVERGAKKGLSSVKLRSVGARIREVAKGLGGDGAVRAE